MLRVLACLTQEHDQLLVGLAVVVLVLATAMAMAAAQRAATLHDERRRADGARSSALGGRVAWLWAGLAAVTLSGGAWSTHFIATLAYDPGLPASFDLARTLLSAAIALAGGAAGFAAWLHASTRTGQFAAGAGTGLVVAVMHYLGVTAIVLPGRFIVSGGYILASVLIGAGVMGVAFAMLRRTRRPWRPAALALAAIAGLHFTGMAGLAVMPDPAAGTAADDLPRALLAKIVAAATLAWLGAGLGFVALQAHLNRVRHAAEATRLRGLADATFEALALCDRTGKIVDANARLSELLEQPLPALLGRDLHDLLTLAAEELHGSSPGSSPLAAAPPVLAALTETRGSVAATLGERLPVEALARPIETAAGPRIVVALRDLRERVAAEQRIRHLAHHDALTDLPNRARLGERLAEAMARAERSRDARLAVLCLDLDRFKAVNDLYGHGAGDRLLREVAIRLHAELRETDTVARIGGDEFVVLQAPLASPADAAALAERLVCRLSEPVDLGDGITTSISGSVGIALYPGDAEDADGLLRAADTALYRVKANGRAGHAFFQAGMERELRARRELEVDLRLALTRGELLLYFQPQAEAASGAVIGFEALLRWQHPKRGMVPPDVFIPVAEGSGAILAIGEWVLREACREAARWTRPLRVSVNVSAIQIQHADFVTLLAGVLQETGLDPARLEIEITESVFVTDVARVLATLRAVKALGAGVALDDFGTGYSSLGTLRSFPFDKIKIDRSFVRSLCEESQSRTIVRAILGLGRGMQLPVVAEGVESESQLAELRREDCAEVQGFLIGRPQPIEAFAAHTGVTPEAAPLVA